MDTVHQKDGTAPQGGRGIEKVATRVPGLDEVLRGGVPLGRTTLIGGGPGTGKSLLALEFLYRSALAGEPGVFVTFEERSDAVRQNARAIGWELEPLEEQQRLSLVESVVPPDMVLSGEFSIEGLLAIVAGQTRELGARLVVIDAVDVLMRVFQDSLRRQCQFQMLHQWAHDQGLTVVLTAKSSADAESAGQHPLLDYLADCVIYLHQEYRENAARRRLRVHKYRGSPFYSKEHPYTITDGGLVLMPIETTELVQAPLGELVSSGNERLDDVLGGGFRQASSVLIAGTSGTGKTTVAASFALAACQRGERVLYVSFEQSQEALVSALRGPGIDLRPQLDDGNLRITTAMPESLGVEDHLLRIFKVEEAFAPRHMIVDAISACHRMGSEEAGFGFLVRLLTHCKERGITCVFTNQLGEREDVEAISGYGISSLVDTLVMLEQVHVPEYRRHLLVLKSRGVNHSHAYHEFGIRAGGLAVPAREGGTAAEGSVNEGGTG